MSAVTQYKFQHLTASSGNVTTLYVQRNINNMQLTTSKANNNCSIEINPFSNTQFTYVQLINCFITCTDYGDDKKVTIHKKNSLTACS